MLNALFAHHKAYGVVKLQCICAPALCHCSHIKRVLDSRIKAPPPAQDFTKIVFDPEQDGVTHINIYSRGKTELGRFLSNFSHTPFALPHWGKFESLEGYWYWLGLPEGKPRQCLRNLHGYQAKQRGQELRLSLGQVEVPDFQEHIKEALKQKLREHRQWLEPFGESSLPFTHYYHYESTGFVKDAGQRWLVDEIESLRTVTKDWLARKKAA